MSSFAQIPSGTPIFLDTNTMVYHFINHSMYGPACTQLLERIEQQDLMGFTSAAVVAELGHRLMTIEAVSRFGWPFQGIAARLRHHPTEVQQLDRQRQAIDELAVIPVQILPVSARHVSLAADCSRNFGLLTNDALLVVVMKDSALQCLASNDSDFDRVSGLTRFAPR